MNQIIATEVCIPKATYSKLVQDSEFLSALMAMGVDSWDGYEAAQELCEDTSD